MVLEPLHTKVNTADIGTKYLDAPGECETQKSIELIEDVWISCVATFLSAHETLRLRAAAVPFNTENLCGEFGPLFFFLLEHMQAD